MFDYYITPIDLDGETFFGIVDAADVRFATLYPNYLLAERAAVLHFAPVGGARCACCGDISEARICRECLNDPDTGGWGDGEPPAARVPDDTNPDDYSDVGPAE